MLLEFDQLLLKDYEWNLIKDVTNRVWMKYEDGISLILGDDLREFMNNDTNRFELIIGTKSLFALGFIVGVRIEDNKDVIINIRLMFI